MCDWSSLQGPVGCVTVTATPRMKAPVTLTPGTTTIRVAGSQVLTPAAKGATVVSTVSYTFSCGFSSPCIIHKNIAVKKKSFYTVDGV